MNAGTWTVSETIVTRLRLTDLTGDGYNWTIPGGIEGNFWISLTTRQRGVDTVEGYIPASTTSFDLLTNPTISIGQSRCNETSAGGHNDCSTDQVIIKLDKSCLFLNSDAN